MCVYFTYPGYRGLRIVQIQKYHVLFTVITSTVYTYMRCLLDYAFSGAKLTFLSSGKNGSVLDPSLWTQSS